MARPRSGKSRRQFIIESIEPRVLLSTTIYVDANATGATHDGTSWNSAFTDLQQGLAAAVSGDEIHVADGTYKPTSGTDRNSTFALRSGVRLFGGYAGFGSTDPNARDVLTLITTLSGDLGKPNVYDTNSLHVVTLNNVDTATTIDGVTIAFGDSRVNYAPADSFGAGILNLGGSPRINNCTISANCGGGMYSTAGSAVITDCIFRGNSAAWPLKGGAIFDTNGSNTQVYRSKFISNFMQSQGGDGGAICSEDSTLGLSDCSFTGNTAGSGGAIRSSGSTLSVLNCWFVGNSSLEGGAIMGFGSAVTLVDSVWIGNSARYGGAVSIDYLTTIANCVFVGNTATVQDGAISVSWDRSTQSIRNSIFWGNTAPTDPQIDRGAYSVSVDYCDVQGGWKGLGQGNINAEPLFHRLPSAGPDGLWGTTDDDSGDLTLQEISPCIDAGNNALLTGVTTDLAGLPRFVDFVDAPDTGAGVAPIVDMGPYEVQAILAAQAGGPYLVLQGQTLSLQGLGSSDLPGPVQLDWEWNGDGLFDDGHGAQPLFDANAFSPGAKVVVQLRATDSAGRTDIDEASMLVVPLTIYVDARATGAKDGASWPSAMTDLALAMNVALPGVTLKVAGGTYTPTASADRSASFHLKSGVSVYGGYGGVTTPDPEARDVLANETVLSGEIGAANDTRDNSYLVMDVRENALASALDGITVSDADATSGQLGGGLFIYRSTVVIANCKFVNNRSGYTGAIQLDDGQLTVTDTSFLSNDGGLLGGALSVMYSGTLVVRRCNFKGNHALWGGAIYAAGSVTVDSSTFEQNTADVGGAVDLDRSHPARISDCVFVRNSATRGGAVFMDGGPSQKWFPQPTWDRCAFLGNRATTRGGAVESRDGSPRFSNCVFIGNSAPAGSVLFALSYYYYYGLPTPTLLQCTLSNNVPGSLIEVADTALLVNNSIVRASPGGGASIQLQSGTAAVDNTNIEGGWAGTGNMDADPRFVRNPISGVDGTWGTVDDDYGDLQLQPTSPCVDAGDNAAVPSGINTDLAGNPRIVDAPGVRDYGERTDMGAYEHLPPLSYLFDAARPTLKMSVAFDVDPTTLSASDLVLLNVTSGQTINTGSAIVSYDAATRSATWQLNGVQPDGQYRATIPAGSVTDVSGSPLATDVLCNFFVLGGDANRDRKVDINDLAILAANWKGTGKVFGLGDFNYDGKVDAADLGILSTHWQQALPPPPASVPVSTVRAPRRTPVRMVSVVG
jgi:predicted outer membrane repeat protein